MTYYCETYVDSLAFPKIQGGRPAGRLEFNLEMEQISEVNVTLKDVQVAGLDIYQPDGTADPYLEYFYSGGQMMLIFLVTNSSGKDAKHFRSPALKGTTSPYWAELEVLYFQTGLRVKIRI